MSHIETMLDTIIRHEGGYVNHPLDRGGPTKYGVTLETLRNYRRDSSLTARDVKGLTLGEARLIYKKNYLERPRIDELPEAVQTVLFDMSVNHGPRNAVKMLQRVINYTKLANLKVDGAIGPKTIQAVNLAHSKMGVYLINAIVDERISFYNAIVRNRPSQKVFLRGWLSRANEFRVPIYA